MRDLLVTLTVTLNLGRHHYLTRINRNNLEITRLMLRGATVTMNFN